MIRAVFGRDRVTVMGHAGYAPKGQDIVCAAASALVFALIGSLRQEENLREVVIRPGYVTAAAKGPCREELELSSRRGVIPHRRYSPQAAQAA